MTLYIKSKLSDLLVEAAKARSIADVLFLTSLLNSESEAGVVVLEDVAGRLILEDIETYQWLWVDVYSHDKTDEEKAAIAEEININQAGLYKLRNSAGG